jgi:hypothetical protein
MVQRSSHGKTMAVATEDQWNESLSTTKRSSQFPQPIRNEAAPAPQDLEHHGERHRTRNFGRNCTIRRRILMGHGACEDKRHDARSTRLPPQDANINELEHEETECEPDRSAAQGRCIRPMPQSGRRADDRPDVDGGQKSPEPSAQQGVRFGTRGSCSSFHGHEWLID